ncbi:MAG TPA: type IV pilus assembly protein PilM [Phycisphaerae bacterium]|nr:type IV pilus assembly protein PilM [Phycisphaerae bacterium]
MAGGQAVWGIDVGKCALKAVRMRAAGDKVELLGSDYIPHAKILSQPDANRDELVAAALEKFLSRNDITNDRVVVSVPGQHTLARFSKLPPVDEKKIPEIVRYEADQQIPFDIDEVIWDYQTFQEEDSPEIEVGIFAMKRELIREYLMHFDNAGIEPIVVQASPLALYTATAWDGLLDKEATTILLDIGAENTDLVVATSYSLWTRTIPLGGNNFTEALVKSFKLSFSKAENLKQSAASSKYARQIFQAMRPIFADLVQELQRSLGFYTSTHRDARLAKCLALGNAFKLPGLQKYLQQNLSLTVERPEAFKRIETSPASTSPPFSEQLLSFGVAYGLALQGLGLGKITSSLLPPEIARQTVWRKKRPFFAAAAACLLLAAGAIWVRYLTDMNAVLASQGETPSAMNTEEAARIIRDDLPARTPPGEYAQTVLAAGEALRREYNQLADQGKDEAATVDRIARLQKNRGLMMRVYQTIHQALPKPQEPLAGAGSPEAYAAAINADWQNLQRGKRNQIFIERLSFAVFPPDGRVLDADVNSLKMEDLVETDVDRLEVTEGMNPEGFIVILDCRTPNAEQVKFVSEQFMTRLRELGRQPGMGFFINRVVLTAGEQLVPDATAAPAAAPGRGPGAAPGARGGAARGATGRDTGAGTSRTGRRAGRGRQTRPAEDETPTATAQFVDPVTNEPMDRDWAFTIECEVILNDAPEPEEEEEEGEEDEY